MSDMKRIDGIDYELQRYRKGSTTQAFVVLVDGEEKPMVDFLVVEEKGRWVILGPHGFRVERKTKPEMFAALAEILHG